MAYSMFIIDLACHLSAVFHSIIVDTEHFDLLKTAINDSPTFKTLRIHDCTAPNEDVNLSNVMESLKERLNIDISGDGAKIQ
jgi:hypothetical protein